MKAFATTMLIACLSVAHAESPTETKAIDQARAHDDAKFCFRVEPFDEEAFRTELDMHGGEAGPTESRNGAEGEGPSIYLTDPEGDVVELKGPADA